MLLANFLVHLLREMHLELAALDVLCRLKEALLFVRVAVVQALVFVLDRIDHLS